VIPEGGWGRRFALTGEKGVGGRGDGGESGGDEGRVRRT